MRTLNKNKQTLYYSNQIGKQPIYQRDASGNIKYMTIDGTRVPMESGQYEMGYTLPIKFEGNIVLSGGESQSVEFGVDVSAYDAVLILNKGELPLSETSLIWQKSKFAYKDSAHTIIEPNSADYRVTKPIPSLNGSRYLLTRIVKNG